MGENGRRIVLVAGPCAVETYGQTMEMGYKVSRVRDAVAPLGIDVMFRGGAWKPRTKCYDGYGGKVFEGRGPEGLGWLSEVAEAYGMPIVTECMESEDLRHFRERLEEGRDIIQVGARNSTNYKLLGAVGTTHFGVLLKNPQHGVDPEEAAGCFQRLGENPLRIYCVRGQKRFIHPDGRPDAEFADYTSGLYFANGQHPYARNLNNIGSIRRLRDSACFNGGGVLIGYDPSHVFGGRDDKMRRMIGEQAVRAVVNMDYDLIEIEVNDRSAEAMCDADQALLTTTRDVDWSETNAGQGPGVRPGAGREPNPAPITLVDIASRLVDYRAALMDLGPGDPAVAQAKRGLDEISWDMKP